MAKDKQTLTFLPSDDYVALWLGESQIFCYHGNMQEMLHNLCKALNLDFTVIDTGAVDQRFVWNHAPNSLPSFQAALAAEKARVQRTKVQAMQAELAAEEKELHEIEQERDRLRCRPSKP